MLQVQCGICVLFDCCISLTLPAAADPEQQSSVRLDAAGGLSQVAAAAQASGTAGQQATIRLVDFCFK